MEKVDEDASLEFKWLKKRSVGGKTKRIQFYDSFIYDGVKYVLYDCVYMYKEGLREPYIGKLTKIWEHWDKTKKVKVQWFFRPEEISKWLGETKTLENEILFASGEGVGLANINPLEAIAGKCNVVCVSKDCRNPQPSDEELKAADFIFYRTFDVQSCTILDKMDEKVGGLEIQYIFNRKEGENTNTAPGSTSDRKEENQNTTFCSEAQQLLTKSLPNKLKDHKDDVKLSVKVDAKGESQGKDIPSLLAERTSLAVIEPSFESGVDSKKVDKANSEMGETDASIFEAHKDNSKLKDMPYSKDKAEKDEIEASIVPVHKVEAKERNKPPTGSDKLHDRPLKKIKSGNKRPPVEKQVEPEVARDSERLKDMPSKKAKVDNSIKLPVDSNSKHEDKLLLHVNNLKASGTSGTNSEMDKTDSCIVEAGKDNSKLMDMACNHADKDEIKVSIGPVRKVETKEKKRTPMGSDKLHDRPLKKIKPDDKTTPKEKQVELEIAGDPERLKDVPSKKSKVDDSIKLPVDSKSKHEEKLTPHVNNLKALGTSGTTEDKPHQKNGKVLLGSAKGKSSAKVTDDLEDGILKKTRADDSLKISDHKKNNSVQNTNGSNSKDLVAPSVSSEGKSDHGLASGSPGTNKDPKVEQSGESKKKPSMNNPGTNKESKVEQSGESKRKLSMSKLSKASSLSMDRDKKTLYQEFVVGPKPNAVS